MRHRRLLLACALSALLACAARTTVDPPLASSGEPGRSLGVILDYKGAPEYVPRTLRNQADAPLVARYAAQARTEREDVNEVLVLYNPLTVLGFPTGSSTATASGTLELLSGERVVREYRATATVRKRNSLYTADSVTDLRKAALLAVRDSLDAQLLGDWSALVRSARE